MPLCIGIGWGRRHMQRLVSDSLGLPTDVGLRWINLLARHVRPEHGHWSLAVLHMWHWDPAEDGSRPQGPTGFWYLFFGWPGGRLLYSCLESAPWKPWGHNGYRAQPGQSWGQHSTLLTIASQGDNSWCYLARRSVESAFGL